MGGFSFRRFFLVFLKFLIFSFQDDAAEASRRLEQQIIIADCHVLEAVINFLHQDWGSYMKGGWVLRKAWKIYQKAYSQIRQIYMQKVGIGNNGIGKKDAIFYHSQSFFLTARPITTLET